MLPGELCIEAPYVLAYERSPHPLMFCACTTAWTRDPWARLKGAAASEAMGIRQY